MAMMKHFFVGANGVNFPRSLLVGSLGVAIALAPGNRFPGGGLAAWGQQSPETVALATESQIRLNHQTFTLPWQQWGTDTNPRWAVSDVGGSGLLGFELLSTNDPQVQPVRWWGKTFELEARFAAPFRYVDITPLLNHSGAQGQRQGSALVVNLPPAQLLRVRQGKQTWGDRWVLDLSGPLFWQATATKDQLTLTLPIPNSPGENPMATGPAPTFGAMVEDEGEGPGGRSPSPSSLAITSQGQNTQLTIQLPPGHQAQITSLDGPHRLVVDVRPDALPQKTIVWHPQITWRQRYLSLGNAGGGVDRFPLVWLELSPEVAGQLRVVANEPQNLVNINPWVTTGRRWGMTAGINGGFFNRDLRLPLGALKDRDQWLSSPILNRGAIAWNATGEFVTGRMALEEILRGEQGAQFEVKSFNSGYVQAGIARYTRRWGETYTPLTDYETLVLVENDRVLSHIKTGPGHQSFYPIPEKGYLLAFRSFESGARQLPVGSGVYLSSRVNPSIFQNYEQVMGAGPLLLQRGYSVLNGNGEQFSRAFQQQGAHRSAIARRQDGTVLLVAAQERVNGKGPTLVEFTRLIQLLGGVEALNLDGGSSSSLFLGGELLNRDPRTAARVHNGIGLFLSPAAR